MAALLSMGWEAQLRVQCLCRVGDVRRGAMPVYNYEMLTIGVLIYLST